MAEDFKAITTQEELDRLITGRLDKQKESLGRKYEGYMPPDEVQELKKGYDARIAELENAAKALRAKAESYDKDIADRDARIKGYESAALKSRIAHEEGLPWELSGRLTGDTEDDIRADARGLARLMGPGDAAPLASAERGADTGRAGLRAMLSQMKGD